MPEVLENTQSKSIGLPSKNLDESVSFYHPHPYSKFQVANSSRLKVIDEKPFISLVSSKIAKNCQTKTKELHAMRTESSNRTSIGLFS